MEQNRPLFWIIDDEWREHRLESDLLQSAFPGCDIRLTAENLSADLESFGRYADAILVQITYPVTRDFLQKLERCRGIAVYGSGYNNIDVAAAREFGIPVTNVRGYCAEDLADYVLAGIMHYNKRIVSFSERITSWEWGANAIHTPVFRIRSQKLFLLGFGSIGSVVAQKVSSIGMQVLVYDPFLSDEQICQQGYRPVSLADGLSQADYVSIHIPMTEQNRAMLDRRFFQQMKPTAVFINVARGGLVNEEDLAEALQTGMISGALLDVVAQEPITPENPLLQAPNCLITPHISYASEESTAELRRRTTENALAMFRGEQPRDLVR